MTNVLKLGFAELSVDEMLTVDGGNKAVDVFIGTVAFAMLPLAAASTLVTGPVGVATTAALVGISVTSFSRALH